MSDVEARRLIPWLFERPSLGIIDGVPQPAPAHFYRCRWFDRETRACGNYDGRPAACRDFPWYGQLPDERYAIAPQCGYNLDVGRQPVPVELTAKPRPH